MANQLYENAGALFLNQNALAEIESFDVDHDAKNSEIITAKGFAGISPGAATTKMTIKSAIPRSGIEFAYIQKLLDNDEVEVVYFRGGKKVKCKGYLMTAKESLSMANPASFEATFVGIPVEESTL